MVILEWIFGLLSGISFLIWFIIVMCGIKKGIDRCSSALWRIAKLMSDSDQPQKVVSSLPTTQNVESDVITEEDSGILSQNDKEALKNIETSHSCVIYAITRMEIQKQGKLVYQLVISTKPDEVNQNYVIVEIKRGEFTALKQGIKYYRKDLNI